MSSQLHKHRIPPPPTALASSKNKLNSCFFETINVIMKGGTHKKSQNSSHTSTSSIEGRTLNEWRQRRHMWNITNRYIFTSCMLFKWLQMPIPKVSKFKNYNKTFKSCIGLHVNGMDDWTLSIKTQDFVSAQHWQISINKFSSCTV